MEIKGNSTKVGKTDMRKLLPRGYGKEIVGRLKGKYSADQVYRVACGKLDMPVIEKELLLLIEEYQQKVQEAKELKQKVLDKYGKY